MPIFERRNFIKLFNKEMERNKKSVGSSKNIKGRERKNMADSFK